MSDPVRELKERAEEMSPHQRALGAVLELWGVLSLMGSIAGSVALAAWITSGRNAASVLIVYFFFAMPVSAALHTAQTRIRHAIARRVLRKLKAPVQRALSGAESSAAFQANRIVDERETRPALPSPSPRPRDEG